mgnify:CR=1 FL=1
MVHPDEVSVADVTVLVDDRLADDGTPPDTCTVEDYRAHPDQAVIFYCAPVQDRPVPHGHVRPDHYGVPAYIHPEDREMLADPAKGLSLDLSAMLRDVTFSEPAEVIEVFDGDTLAFGSMVFEVDHVPGHSPGSVSFRITAETEEGPRMVVLGGDVLFLDGVGRTDLPAGDPEVLMQSIAKKFLVLDDDAVVLPGHGPSTTIGRERRSNPFLRDL